MIWLKVPDSFEQFRKVARSLLCDRVSPDLVAFRTSNQSLFVPFFDAMEFKTPKASHQNEKQVLLRLPKKRLIWMKSIALFRSEDTWHLLYRLLWKALQNPLVLGNPADADVIEAERRAKQVSRDIHKMHAFVRFNKTLGEEQEYFVAWHKPQHKILQAVVPFFKNRFASMRWSILTPDQSAHWNGKNLIFTEGVAVAPNFSDPYEKNWLSYYSSIFNPARIKLEAMKNEMPRRYWDSMPETRLIPELLAQAPERLKQMRAAALVRAVVPNYTNLNEVKEACQQCKSCPIACLGGQAVFGEGPENQR